MVGAITAEVLWRPTAPIAALAWLGRALVFLGAGLTLWAYRVLGKSYAPTAHHPDPSQTLVRSGPYRWLAHPQYAGNLLSVIGLLTALGLRWAWLSLPPFAAAQAWRVRREERFLATRFGPEWRKRGLKQEARTVEEQCNDQEDL